MSFLSSGCLPGDTQSFECGVCWHCLDDFSMASYSLQCRLTRIKKITASCFSRAFLPLSLTGKEVFYVFALCDHHLSPGRVAAYQRTAPFLRLTLNSWRLSPQKDRVGPRASDELDPNGHSSTFPTLCQARGRAGRGFASYARSSEFTPKCCKNNCGGAPL